MNMFGMVDVECDEMGRREVNGVWGRGLCSCKKRGPFPRMRSLPTSDEPLGQLRCAAFNTLLIRTSS